jgi:squalene monooxygenase
VQVFGYCIIKNGKEAKIHYPSDGYEGEIAGRSFHNGRFVQKLRQAAQQQANITIRQATVKKLLNGVFVSPMEGVRVRQRGWEVI